MMMQSVESVDEARRLRETSEQLHQRAVNTATNIEEGSQLYITLQLHYSVIPSTTRWNRICNVILY